MTGPMHGPAIDWTRYARDVADGIRHPSGWVLAGTGILALGLWTGLVLGDLRVSSPGTWVLAVLAMGVTAATVRMVVRRREPAQDD